MRQLRAIVIIICTTFGCLRSADFRHVAGQSIAYAPITAGNAASVRQVDMIGRGSTIGWIYRPRWLQWLPDNQHLAAVTSTGAWFLDSATPDDPGRFVLPGASEIAFSPDGTYTAVTFRTVQSSYSNWSYSVSVYETAAFLHADFAQPATMLFSIQSCNCGSVVFSPDSRLLIVPLTTSVQVWDIGSKTLKQTLPNVNNVASGQFISDGKTLVLFSTGLISIWDTATWKLQRRIRGYYGDYPIMSADGKITVSTDSYNVVVTNASGYGIDIAASSAWEEQFGVSPDLSLIALPPQTDPNAVLIWNTQAYTTENLLKASGSDDNPGREIQAVAFSPDGGTVAASDETDGIRLWDVKSGKVRLVIPTRNDVVSNIRFSSDSTLLAGMDSYGTIHVWRVLNGQPDGQQVSHWDYFLYQVFSADLKGPYAALGTETAQQTRYGGVYVRPTFLLWNIDEHNAVYTSNALLDYGDQRVALSANGRLAALGGSGTLRLWDIQLGALINKFSAESTAVAFSSDGKWVAVNDGYRPQHVAIFDVETGVIQAELDDGGEEIADIAFSPDDKRIAASYGSSTNCYFENSDDSQNDHTIRLWDWTNKLLLQTFKGHTATVYSISFSHDGQRLASAGGDGTVRVWDTSSGTQIHSFSASSRNRDDYFYNSGRNCSVSFNQDGSLLAVANENLVLLLNANNGTVLARLTGHTDIVTQVKFNQDGTELISSSADGTARLWAVSQSPPSF